MVSSFASACHAFVQQQFTGASGAGAKIPGGATLVFDVELLDIKNAAEEL